MAKATKGNGKGNGNGDSKPVPNPEVGKAALEALKKGKEPAPAQPEAEVPKTNEAKDDERFVAISDGSCVNQLQKAFGFSKSALHLECAVAIAVFMTSKGGSTDLETKRHVRELYGQAGYDVNPNGEDYKTIVRRVNAFADLFNYEDEDTWNNAIEDATEEQAIEALKNFITQEYGFKGINDIKAHVGKPVAQTNTKEAQQKRAGQAGENTSTTAGGGKGENVAQGTPGAGGADQSGHPLTQAGEPDKRVKGEGEEMAQGQQTRAEHGLQGTTKEEQGQRQPSPEDRAVAAKAEEQAKEGGKDVKFGRRAQDRGIVLIAGELQLGIPFGTSGKDIQEMFSKLATLAAAVTEDTIIDESFSNFSDSPNNEQSRRVTH